MPCICNMIPVFNTLALPIQVGTTRIEARNSAGVRAKDIGRIDLYVPRVSGDTRPVAYQTLPSSDQTMTDRRDVTLSPLRALYVGQIVGRYDAGRMDAVVNIVEGRPFIRVHNWGSTVVKLEMYDGSRPLQVGPNEINFYKGPGHRGVPYGITLKDLNGVYPDYLVTDEITDIYYGITSENPQPLVAGQVGYYGPPPY